MVPDQEFNPDKKIIQSYVYYEDKAFFVSTIERDYSTPQGLTRGEETIVWEWDPGTRKRGDLIYQAGGLTDHLDICKQLSRSGEYNVDETQ